MSQKTMWKIQYINLCINVFAQKHRLTSQVAFRYLQQYKGLEFLDLCYEAEHLQPLNDTQDSLRTVCRQNGGSI
ncbi:MAG: DUF3791 domain-containing protein [Bacteroidales bacterium]|nr:DUF3791 domain-containing protein [Bacteroidales bacterium]